jgi:hypothetical protein
MHLAVIIVYISTIVWILPIFRQYNTRIFYFFLILGLSDPANIISVSLFTHKTGLVYCIAALLLFYSLNLREHSRLKFTYTDFLLIILFVSAIFLLNDLNYLILCIHLIILVRFIQKVVIDVHQKGEANVFYLMLILYETTVIVKIVVFLFGSNVGVLFFYITLAFQILIGIFFTLFKENNPFLNLKLTTVNNN